MLNAPSLAENCGEAICPLSVIPPVAGVESPASLNQQNNIIAAEVLVWVKRYMRAKDASWQSNDLELARNDPAASLIVGCAFAIAHGDCRKFVARRTADRVEVRRRLRSVS